MRYSCLTVATGRLLDLNIAGREKGRVWLGLNYENGEEQLRPMNGPARVRKDWNIYILEKWAEALIWYLHLINVHSALFLLLHLPVLIAQKWIL